MQQIAALRPAGTIIVEEAPSSRGAMQEHLPMIEPNSFHTCASGGLGHGLPAAVGVALARPDRKVVALLGDGSAMYAIQGLWTAAELALPVVFIIVNNGSYEALVEFGEHFRLAQLPGTQSAAPGFLRAGARPRRRGPARRAAAINCRRRSGTAFAATGPTLVDVCVAAPTRRQHAPGRTPKNHLDAGATMSHVLTLMGPGLGNTPSIPAVAGTILRDAGATVAATDWLAPGKACDISFSAAQPARVENAVRAAFASADLDIAVQPSAGRRKQLLVADMESTIITRELLDELAGLAGHGAEVATITSRSMRGEIDFARSLRERVAMLAGQPLALLDRVTALIELTAGARPLVRTMRAHGAWTVLVSGGFDAFAARVAADCGFDEFRANRLESPAS